MELVVIAAVKVVSCGIVLLASVVKMPCVEDVVVVRAEVVLMAPGPEFPLGSWALVIVVVGMLVVAVSLVISTRNNKHNICRLMMYSRAQS